MAGPGSATNILLVTNLPDLWAAAVPHDHIQSEKKGHHSLQGYTATEAGCRAAQIYDST